MSSKNTNSGDGGCLGPILAFMAFIVFCIFGYYYNTQALSLMGTTYEITVTDHNGQVVYADSGWANTTFYGNKEELVVLKEDKSSIRISGASLEREE